jgi:glycosyltransferase involved in cell wall biosynthesis
MKVLMLTPTYYPIVGGAETAISRLTVGLNSRGIQTDVMTFNMDKVWNSRWRGKTELSDEGFRIFRIPGLNWYPFPHSNRITMGVNLIPGRFMNLTKSYDILHFHTELSFPLFSYFSKKPKVYHFHGLNFQFLKRYFLARFLLKRVADQYISLTRQMKNDLANLGIPKRKITCLPNGVDTAFFRPSNEKEDNLLLFVGRMTPSKGLHVLLKALAYIRRPVRLVLIGPKDWNSKYFSNILESIQTENDKGKHRIEYACEKSQKDLVNWYQRATIFVLPSTGAEAFGIVNLEALACETPVVATNVGGVSEIVKDGENGLLVEPNNALKLGNAIEYLLENGDLRKEFGRAGRKLVVEQFSIEAVVRKLIALYNGLAR